MPMRFYATHFKYIIVVIRSAHTGNKLVSALVPRPPPLSELAELPFPSFWGWEAERDSALQFQKCIDRGGGKGAGCRRHPRCRAGIPGFTAWAGGLTHRDLL